MVIKTLFCLPLSLSVHCVLRYEHMGNFRDDRSGSRGNFGRRDFGGRREMHKAVCSSCGRDCEVPFEPTGSKPVYCSECFEKNGGRGNSGRFQDRGPRRPDFERRNEPRPQNNEQLEVINHKLDKILEMLTVTKPKKKKTPVTKE